MKHVKRIIKLIIFIAITIAFLISESNSIDVKNKVTMEYENFNIPAGSFYYNDHYYYIYDYGYDMDLMKLYCNSIGGYLADLSDETEKNAVLEFVESQGYLDVSYAQFEDENHIAFICEWDNYIASRDKRLEKEVKGLFKDSQSQKIIESKQYYTDAYFESPSMQVQYGLAKLSMLSAASVYNKGHAERLMEECEFDTHKYVKKTPTDSKNDTVSYEIGVRTVDGITIIAVWVKGTSADYEWISNWRLGKEDTHEGFVKAEEAMYKEIKEYLSSQHIPLSNEGGIKMWITGHSRGAAVANLFAKRMTDEIGLVNVYAYTFATPRVSKGASRAGCENIFNYINSGDFVTEVAPKAWGYKRYGVDVLLDTSKKGEMESKFEKLSGDTYDGFNESEKNSLVSAFLKFAGTSNQSYYKKNSVYTPEFFCSKGLGYILSGLTSTGISNCLKVCVTNADAAIVFGKMAVDGQITDKFKDAHVALTYMCWLDEMYK